MVTDVSNEIECYRPFNSDEAKYRALFLKFLKTTTDPWDRNMFHPGHLTVGAFIVSATHRRVLMILHKKLQIWLQPGGHIEPYDRSPEAAVKREVVEEVGLKAPHSIRLFDLDIHTIPGSRNVPAHLHYDMRYLFVISGLPDIRTSEAEARWCSMTDFESLAVDDGIHRMLEKAHQGGFI